MRRGLSLGVCAVLLLSGCGGPDQVETDQLERQVSDNLAEEYGVTPEAVACPAPLPAEVDASVRCTLADAGSTYGVTLTVTSVDGDNARFDIAVDPEPQG